MTHLGHGEASQTLCLTFSPVLAGITGAPELEVDLEEGERRQLSSCSFQHHQAEMEAVFKVGNVYLQTYFLAIGDGRLA